jgi:hypothetical protein
MDIQSKRGYRRRVKKVEEHARSNSRVAVP